MKKMDIYTLPKFESAKEMVNWLMINEYSTLLDKYGRAWKYADYEFKFRDLDNEWSDGIKCLHLFGTEFHYK